MGGLCGINAGGERFLTPRFVGHIRLAQQLPHKATGTTLALCLRASRSQYAAGARTEPDTIHTATHTGCLRAWAGAFCINPVPSGGLIRTNGVGTLTEKSYKMGTMVAAMTRRTVPTRDVLRATLLKPYVPTAMHVIAVDLLLAFGPKVT